VDFLPKTMLDIAVPSERAAEVIATIVKAANTGKIGDGKIFVLPIEYAMRIRTGESGDGAL